MQKDVLGVRNRSEYGNVDSVLFVGYNGANNTGSEARLLSILEDVRDVFGKEVRITVPTLNEKNLRRYLEEDEFISIIPVHPVFFFAVWRLVKQHDLVLLVEGSCYMDTWTSALLWLFLWAAWCADHFDIPIVAYSVDAGTLSPLNSYLVRIIANRTDLIITRSPAAEARLKELGVTAPIKTTADAAITGGFGESKLFFRSNYWDKSDKGVVGIAPVDFYCWPVVVRICGRRSNCYRWPYYFSRSQTRSEKRKELAGGLATIGDRLVANYDKNVALICMEELDEKMAGEVLSRMVHFYRAHIFSSSEVDAQIMSTLLQSLDILITSRYHAAVLSLPGYVPQIALGHDTRLKGLYADLNLGDYFFDVQEGYDWRDVEEKVDQLLGKPRDQIETLKNGFRSLRSRARQNRVLLRTFVEEDLSGEGQ